MMIVATPCLIENVLLLSAHGVVRAKQRFGVSKSGQLAHLRSHFATPYAKINKGCGLSRFRRGAEMSLDNGSKDENRPDDNQLRDRRRKGILSSTSA